VALEPASVLQGVTRFFQDQVIPNDVMSAEAWTLRGTAFLDFVAVGVEVRLYSVSATSPSTIGVGHTSMVVFKHTTANDIVRFGSVFALAIQSLRSQSLPVQAPKSASLTVQDPFCDEFDDDDIDEEPWCIRMEPLLQAIDSKSAATREEAWQTLASWGKTRPDCRQDLARGLFEDRVSGLMVKALEADSASTLAELYPMVVALKYAVPSYDVVGEVDKNLQLLLETERTHLPVLVQAELTQALSYISSDGDDGYRTTWQGDADRSTWGADRSTWEGSRCTIDSFRPASHSDCPVDDFATLAGEASRQELELEYQEMTMNRSDPGEVMLINR